MPMQPPGLLQGKVGLKSASSKVRHPGLSMALSNPTRGISMRGCHRWTYWHQSVSPVISPVPLCFNILFELVGPVPRTVHDYAFVYFGFHPPLTGPSIKLFSGLLKFPVAFACSEHSVQFGSSARFFLRHFSFSFSRSLRHLFNTHGIDTKTWGASPRVP